MLDLWWLDVGTCQNTRRIWHARKSGVRTSTLLSIYTGSYSIIPQFHAIQMISFHLYLYGVSKGPLQSSFEAVEGRLRQLDAVYFEPDGSFVLSRESGSEQVFGMLYDAAGQLQYCDLRGNCGINTWKMVRNAILGEEVANHEVLLLPSQELKDLQSFENCLIKSQPGDSA